MDLFLRGDYSQCRDALLHMVDEGSEGSEDRGIVYLNIAHCEFNLGLYR
jgi:hypothetical protein